MSIRINYEFYLSFRPRSFGICYTSECGCTAIQLGWFVLEIVNNEYTDPVDLQETAYAEFN